MQALHHLLSLFRPLDSHLEYCNILQLGSLLFCLTMYLQQWPFWHRYLICNYMHKSTSHTITDHTSAQYLPLEPPSYDDLCMICLSSPTFLTCFISVTLASTSLPFRAFVPSILFLECSLSHATLTNLKSLLKSSFLNKAYIDHPVLNCNLFCYCLPSPECRFHCP